MSGYFAGAYFGEAEAGSLPPISLAPSTEGRNRERILSALRQIGAAGPFYKVVYSTAGIPTLGSAVSPASCEANETQSDFGTPRLNRRADLRERRSWPFQVILSFNGPHEVSLEEWEHRLQTPVRYFEDVVGADTRRSRSVSIRIRSVEYDHPPRGGGSATGTKAVAIFDVEVSPL